jgi:hypothetical protein
MSARRGRVRRLWTAVRRVLRRPDPTSGPPWSDEDPALVPVGPPRRRPPAAGAALEPPTEPDPLEYPTETEAYGRLVDEDDDEETGGLRAAAN